MAGNTGYSLNHYESDVVQYTQSGKHPVLKKPYCYITKFSRTFKLKKFYTKKQAEIALAIVTRNVRMHEKYMIFQCAKCGMYHIISANNYKKYERQNNNFV